jgi:hypothetical protein
MKFRERTRREGSILSRAEHQQITWIGGMMLRYLAQATGHA